MVLIAKVVVDYMLYKILNLIQQMKNLQFKSATKNLDNNCALRISKNRIENLLFLEIGPSEQKVRIVEIVPESSFNKFKNILQALALT